METEGVQPPGANRSRWAKLPVWARWTIGVVVALLLLGIGAAMGSSDEDSLKSEITELESQVATAEHQQERAEDEVTDARSEASRVKGLRSKIVDEAQESAEKIVDSAKGEAEELASVEGEIEEAESRLSSVESSIGGAKEEAAKSTISDGIWQSETDYIPGTYRAPGGSTCYWATLNSADPYDIASNENGTGAQIASIESPYFQTKGCGTWERIDE
jgi:hypothetical protein